MTDLNSDDPVLPEMPDDEDEDQEPSATAPWGVHFGKDSNGRPMIRLEKGEHWVEFVGREGIDREILYQRAIIEALKMDMDHAKSENDRRFIEQQLKHALKDEEISQAMRRDARIAAGEVT